MAPEQEAVETPELRRKRLAKERQSRFRKRQMISDRNERTDESARINNGKTRHELGRMDQICAHCGAKFWLEEKDCNSSRAFPTFSTCCAHGKVLLPHLLEPLPYLLNLYTSLESDAISFRKNIRRYNNVLACTSFGASIDTIPGQGISNFRIHGQVYHLIGPLLPEEGQQPAFAQLYIYDSEHENEYRNNVMQVLDDNILQNLLKMLDECNPYIQNFRYIRDLIKTNVPDEIFMIIHGDRTQDSRRYNAPTASEVAAIMVGDGHELHTANRDILLRMHDGGLQRISEIHPSYDPLHYILLFPKGDDGWHVDMPLIGAKKRERVTTMQFYSYRLQIRDGDWLQRAGRLYQQYIVDQYAKIEQNRLNYLKNNQDSLHTDLYNGVSDAIHSGDSADSTQIGRRIILPSSFAGSPRQMYQLYQDAMTIVSHFGKPDLFVTFTCNPKWPEITRELLPHQSAVDRPDLTARVFHIKLQELLKDLLKKDCLGKVIAYIYVIEFQKRGLPHAHFLLILAPENKLRSTENYDSIVSAEIPNPISHPLAYETVSTMMMHGPCGAINPAAPCMKNGVCQKHYPKKFHENTQEDNNGYPIYRRRNNGCFVETSNGFQLDNRWVVPHNVDLVTKYNAHINVEICSSVLSTKYLYKYVYKGHNRATITLYRSDHDSIQPTLDQTEPIDEIKLYLDARYVSASESIWRIFHYRMHGRSPKVQRLAVHLPNHQYITFRDGENLQNVIERADSRKTTLTAWFQEKMDNNAARVYTYGEFPNHYTWDMKEHKWRSRKTATIMIGRIYMVQPSEGERYYLRTLLTHVRGAISFENLKTIDGYTCRSFKEACIRLSLLQDDDEWNECLLEASAIQSGKQLRHLFASILLFCQPVNPEILWNDHRVALCEDICYQNHVLIQSQNDNIPDMIEREALCQLEDILLLNGKSLKDFPDMPIPPPKTLDINYYNEDLDQLIREEQSYDIAQLRNELLRNIPLLNDDQRNVYEAVMQAVALGDGCFFIDGPGGTGKTFLYNALLSTVRSSGEIAVAVASSGIAALLIMGGRTAHSRFKIPLKLNESSTCNISRGSKDACLINLAKLFIWDEAPMIHKFAFEALDQTFRDITQVDKPFGGKVFVFGGDFRQVLPVIPRASRAEVVSASICRSSLWSHMKVMKLSINMRLHQTNDAHENQRQKNFADLLLQIGDGKYPVIPNTENTIELPSPMVIPGGKLSDLIDFVYSNLIENSSDMGYMVGRAILTPKNDDVEHISTLIMNRFPGEFHTYPSADSVDLTDDDNTDQPQLYSPEFLRSLKIPGLSPGELRLKVGIPIMLLRNLNPSEGLCNGTRLICRGLYSKVIDAEIITGPHVGNRTFIPRISLTPSDANMPFVLKRRQFPVRVAFSMTVNKSQGQTLNHVGLYLPQPVFSHGQLYVALSRVTSNQCIKVLINRDQKCQTKNVVYSEIFR